MSADNTVTGETFFPIEFAGSHSRLVRIVARQAVEPLGSIPQPARRLFLKAAAQREADRCEADEELVVRCQFVGGELVGAAVALAAAIDEVKRSQVR